MPSDTSNRQRIGIQCLVIHELPPLFSLILLTFGKISDAR